MALALVLIKAMLSFPYKLEAAEILQAGQHLNYTIAMKSSRAVVHVRINNRFQYKKGEE